jgi:putative zinc finger/helix-turn-helix YgiT family protein
MEKHAELLEFPQKETDECPACHQHSIVTTSVDSKFVYGAGRNAVELSCTTPVQRCSQCDFEFTDQRAEEARDLAVRRHLGVFTAEQIRDLRESYELSRREFGELTRIGEASLARWENGDIIQNSGYDQFLYLLGFPENLQRLREKLDKKPEPNGDLFSANDLKTRFPSIKDHAKVVEIASRWRLRKAS